MIKARSALSESGKCLDPESLLSALPPPLRDASAERALAATAAEALARQSAEMDRLRIYTRLNELPEELLDILAYDFKVDWWNPDYTLEEKRRVLRDSWYVHRHMGTRAAVETALKAVYRDAAILEWFEYGGRPGYFRLWTDVTNEDFIPVLRREILRRMNYYKRLGAHLEDAGYYMKAEPSRAWAYLVYGGQVQKRWGEVVPPPTVGPPRASATAIYGGVLAGMAGAAERTAVIPSEVKPPSCKPSQVSVHFQFMNQVQRYWNGMVPPPSVGPPKAETKAVYGSVLAGMAGSGERTVRIPPEVGPPVCKPSCAAAWAGHIVLRGRMRGPETILRGEAPRAETSAVYGGVLAGMAGHLRITDNHIELGI